MNTLSRHDARIRATALIAKVLMDNGHSEPYSYLMAFMATKAAPSQLWQGNTVSLDKLQFTSTLADLIEAGELRKVGKKVSQGSRWVLTVNLSSMDELDELLSKADYQALWAMVGEAEKAVNE